MTPTHLMTVEKLTGRKNSFHETPEEYAPAFELWVELMPLSQKEQERAAGVGRQTTHRIKSHYHPDLDGSCRFSYLNRTFDIVSIINVGERGREYEISVNEIEADGA